MLAGLLDRTNPDLKSCKQLPSNWFREVCGAMTIKGAKNENQTLTFVPTWWGKKGGCQRVYFLSLQSGLKEIAPFLRKRPLLVVNPDGGDFDSAAPPLPRATSRDRTPLRSCLTRSSSHPRSKPRGWDQTRSQSWGVS